MALEQMKHTPHVDISYSNLASLLGFVKGSFMGRLQFYQLIL